MTVLIDHWLGSNLHSGKIVMPDVFIVPKMNSLSHANFLSATFPHKDYKHIFKKVNRNHFWMEKIIDYTFFAHDLGFPS